MITVGVLGGGQLAKMLALAAAPLGISILCYDPAEEACAKQIAPVITASYSDKNALKAFADSVDVLTFETENISPEIFSLLEGHKHLFYPNEEALLISQDRYLEKECFHQEGVKTASYEKIDSFEDLERGVARLNMPCILKTRRGGYDGKGQYVLRSSEDLLPAWNALKGAPAILESFVPFEKEVSMIGVRSQEGEIRIYPLVENQHEKGILRESFAPFEHESLKQEAKAIIEKILLRLNYVGVLTIEFFLQEGTLIANEMAPRVHNTGHWTMEGAVTSQFENHLRAITGFPLGDPSPRGYSWMVNIIGEELSQKELMMVNGLHYHHYGKLPRPGRKLGHFTCNASRLEDLKRMQKEVLEINSRF